MLVPCRIIVTRYHGPTDTRGSRVSARVPSGRRVVVPWDHARNHDENHDVAALALASALDWPAPTHRGWSPDDRGYTYVVPVPE